MSVVNTSLFIFGMIQFVYVAKTSVNVGFSLLISV